jgi:Putative transposase
MDVGAPAGTASSCPCACSRASAAGSFSSDCRLRSTAWVVYAKRPFGGPKQVLDYLGRYTHRVAIANSRLIDCENGQVRFRWKDYRANGKSKVMKLAAGEFIRRFLLHVVPDGFRRIRHFGFLANAHRSAKLAQVRAALHVGEPPPKTKPMGYRERYALLTGKSLDLCPCCGGRMIEVAILARPTQSTRSRWDTS